MQIITNVGWPLSNLGRRFNLIALLQKSDDACVGSNVMTLASWYTLFDPLQMARARHGILSLNLDCDRSADISHQLNLVPVSRKSLPLIYVAVLGIKIKKISYEMTTFNTIGTSK
jgi:hypothetical protein